MKTVRFVLAAILALLPVWSWADMMLKDGSGNSIVLHEGKCTVLSWLKDWRQATMQYRGTMFEACWRIQGDMVVVLDSGGDVTPVPMQAFRPVVNI